MVKLIGVVLVVIAVICIYVGRSNYNSLQSLKSEIDKYKSDNPVSTFFFGVTLTDKAQQEATSASKFAYSFTPPLTPKELLVYLGLAVGIVMVIWGQGLITPSRATLRRLLVGIVTVLWGQGLGENQKSTQEFTPPVQTAPASPSYFGIIICIDVTGRLRTSQTWALQNQPVD